MPRDGSAPPEISETAKQGWRDFGRHAARNDMDLKLVLTNNPALDVYIREGFEQVRKAREAVRSPPPVDPFPYDLLGSKIETKSVRGRR